MSERGHWRQALKTLGFALDICAIVTAAWGKLDEKILRLISPYLSGNSGYFETKERSVMGRVLKPIVVLDMSEYIEVFFHLLKIEKVINAKFLHGTTDGRFGSSYLVSLNDRVSIRKFEIGADGIVRCVKIDKDIEIFGRGITSVIDVQAKKNPLKLRPIQIHGNLSSIGNEDERSLDLIQIFGGIVVGGPHRLQLIIRDDSIDCCNSSDDYRCCRAGVVSRSKQISSDPSEHLHFNPPEWLAVIVGCAFVALAVLFLNGTLCALDEQQPKKSLFLFGISLVVWAIGVYFIYLGFAENVSASPGIDTSAMRYSRSENVRYNWLIVEDIIASDSLSSCVPHQLHGIIYADPARSERA